MGPAVLTAVVQKNELIKPTLLVTKQKLLDPYELVDQPEVWEGDVVGGSVGGDVGGDGGAVITTMMTITDTKKPIFVSNHGQPSSTEYNDHNSPHTSIYNDNKNVSLTYNKKRSPNIRNIIIVY
jgi:hypothetical protein